MKTLSHKEFMEELHLQNVPPKDFAFICPMCKTVQSMKSLVNAGVGDYSEAEKYIGFSCLGRWTDAGPPCEVLPVESTSGRGCNWTLGGLFKLHKLEVILDGESRPCFEVASPEQAQELAEKNK